MAKLCDQTVTQLAEETAQLVKEREVIMKLKADLSKSKLEVEELAAGTAIKDNNILRMTSELEAKSRALGEKDATISAMNEQLTKARECLGMKQQVSIIRTVSHTVPS